MSQKPRPEPNPELVFHPERDSTYVHFEHAAAHPFEPDASLVNRRNAWWLGDAALLSYWDRDEAFRRFAGAGLEAELVDVGEVQCYLASGATFAIVAFRGTEPDRWSDVLDDALFAQAPWTSTTHVHVGFKRALDRIWPVLGPKLDALGTSKAIWLTGHSLGAALATLAADRFPQTAGVCTLGSPRVGDRAFAHAFNARFGNRARRYVHDTDVVTHVPPPIPCPHLYEHVSGLRHVAPNGTISSRRSGVEHFFRDLIGSSQHVLDVTTGLRRGTMRHAPKFLLDHMPRAYTVAMWNDYDAHGR